MQKLFKQSTTNKERKLKIPVREHINKNQKYKNLEKVQILLLELRQKLTELNKNMRNTNKNDRKRHRGCHWQERKNYKN